MRCDSQRVAKRTHIKLFHPCGAIPPPRHSRDAIPPHRHSRENGNLIFLSHCACIRFPIESGMTTYIIFHSNYFDTELVIILTQI